MELAEWSDSPPVAGHHMLHMVHKADGMANAEKCEFGNATINFLGHKVTADGFSPLPDRVEAIKQHPSPNTMELQNFLGVLTPSVAWTLALLKQALQGSPSPRTLVESGREKEAVFWAAKETLQKGTNLAFHKKRAELAVMVDASKAHVGAAQQWRADPAAP